MATLKLNMDGGISITTTREEFPLTGDELLIAVMNMCNDMVADGEPFVGFETDTGETILVNVARINTIEEVL